MSMGHESSLAMIHPDDLPAVQAWLARLEDTGEGELEYRLRTGNGEFRWLSNHASITRDSEDRALYRSGNVRDITEKKKAEEALLRSEKLASVGRMASTIAHEINNPLEAVGNALYLALTGSKIAEDTKSYLDMAVEELDRVSHITRQTLAFHHQTSTPTQIDLREMIDGALQIFAPRLKSRGVAIVKRTPPVGRIRGFGGEIQQIISNLLSNSMDAVPNNGRIEFRLSQISGNGDGCDKVRFTIADTGSGIPPDRLGKMFEPFFTTKEMHGTGLGLWVTKQIVEKHEASIRVRSKLGRGTVFSITFPVAEQAAVC
jgi:signal transduction histidine kinase